MAIERMGMMLSSQSTPSIPDAPKQTIARVLDKKIQDKLRSGGVKEAHVVIDPNGNIVNLRLDANA